MKMNFLKKKGIRITLFIIGLIYAIIGFGLTSAWLAVKLKLTNDPGTVDVNDRYFQEMANKDLYKNAENDTLQQATQLALAYYKTAVLSQFYPKNAQMIIDVLKETGDPVLAEHMLDAAGVYLKDSAYYMNPVSKAMQLATEIKPKPVSHNLYRWMNLEEWPVLKEALSKDKRVIDSVSALTDVSSRLISSVLIAEQIRLFDSRREAFKKWIQPLKILSNETTFSWGVTGVKEFTAQRIEQNLKDKNSDFYIGEKYEKLLEFSTTDISGERFQRIANPRNHFYAYLYAALCIRQIEEQWKKAGFDISKRPEIMATLYNVGYDFSKPKADPQVGGSNINVGGVNYTFGKLAYEYYFSGELSEIFPFPAKGKY